MPMSLAPVVERQARAGPAPASTRKPPAMVMFFMKLIICIVVAGTANGRGSPRARRSRQERSPPSG